MAALAPTGGLTPRQRDVLAFIADSLAREGWAPTRKEIGAYLGSGSSGHAQHYLDALTAAGCIERGFAQARAIRLTTAGQAALAQEGAESRL